MISTDDLVDELKSRCDDMVLIMMRYSDNLRLEDGADHWLYWKCETQAPEETLWQALELVNRDED